MKTKKATAKKKSPNFKRTITQDQLIKIAEATREASVVIYAVSKGCSLVSVNKALKILEKLGV